MKHENAIAPEISYLWGALDATLGQNAAENKISTWTDSWLISVLSRSFTELCDMDSCQEFILDGRTEEELDKLKSMLDELLLNRKHYFPIMKRQRDAVYLTEEILKRAAMSKEVQRKLLKKEYTKMFEETGDKSHEGSESLYRLGILQDDIQAHGDFNMLGLLFPPSEGSFKKAVEKILEAEIEKRTIKAYFVCNNPGYQKTGITDAEKDQIYLYGKETDTYDIGILEEQLLAQRATGLTCFVYISPADGMDAEALKSSIEQEIIEKVGSQLQNQFEELFGISEFADRGVDKSERE